ncbi:MAG: cytochrome c peroxidase [Bacteroidota bacterium]
MRKILLLTALGTFIVTFLVIQSCSKNENFNRNDEKAIAMSKSGPGMVTLNNMELLGKQIFFDNISAPNNQSCASCHKPEYGFTGPNSGQNLVSGIYHGAIATRFGNRKPPSAAYATLSPVFHFEDEDGLFEGGNFWDGRATGERLGNPAAEQALGPFLNPVEQNNSSKESVLKQIAASQYLTLWTSVWGSPLSYETPDQIKTNYDRVGLAIAAYEGSAEVNQFTSKFDYYLKGMVELTELENQGMILFNGKGKCNLCHSSDDEQPLFTDFTFDNLGTPKNPGNPFYAMNTIFLPDGNPVNPLGSAWVDPGLGGFLQNHPNPAWQAMAAENWGKHQVPTLRNVDKRPGPGNTKAYMHNGVFKSLAEVVHFYNTRDILSWPPPEVAQNVNTEELGNLGLTAQEELAIVAFLKTLSDGYVLKNNGNQ